MLTKRYKKEEKTLTYNNLLNQFNVSNILFFSLSLSLPLSPSSLSKNIKDKESQKVEKKAVKIQLIKSEK